MCTQDAKTDAFTNIDDFLLHSSKFVPTYESKPIFVRNFGESA